MTKLTLFWIISFPRRKVVSSYQSLLFFSHGSARVGMLRIIVSQNRQIARLSPLLILLQFQGRGYAQQMLRDIEIFYPSVTTWHLDTIAEEKKLVHLYKKMGYIQDITKITAIKPGMTIIYFSKIISKWIFFWIWSVWKKISTPAKRNIFNSQPFAKHYYFN